MTVKTSRIATRAYERAIRFHPGEKIAPQGYLLSTRGDLFALRG